MLPWPAAAFADTLNTAQTAGNLTISYLSASSGSVGAQITIHG
jgi:hypothetical protein